ncbi:hypothetical protein N7445_000200 [Penicillium cf. griseofulvum]|nr:hypothetical protein N7445_000200 [Penicillium cf. griseofulvum]
MASADGVFRDYASLTEILDLADDLDKHCPTENQVLETIFFKESALKTPVFRQFTELAIEKTTGEARGADSFGKTLVELGHRSGYVRNVTVRASRRWDKKYSETARMKMAGHENRHTFGKSYTHPVSEIDGPATYLGIASRHEHIQNRRGMGMYRNAQLWQSLPAKAEFEFQERNDIRALDKDMEILSVLLSEATGNEEKHQIQLKQHRAYNEKKRLYIEHLKGLQRSQPHGFRPATNSGSNINEETLFRYRRRVMPERDYLVMILPQKIGLRSSEGRRALEALESLCTLECSVAYRSSLQPLNGKYGYTFIVVKGRNFVIWGNMNLQNSALSAIIGLMIV